jgi:oxygen-dependent protoporphyrinogen oxidase
MTHTNPADGGGSGPDGRYDQLVLGAGISGLGMAHAGSRRGLRSLLLEAEPEPGGCIRSHAFPGTGGFWVELGSHTCYNSYGHLLDLVAGLGLTGTLRPKAPVRFRLLRDGQLKSVFAALHPLELAWHLPRLFREPKAGRSVAGYYSRVLGPRNYRELFGPAFSAVICQEAGEFPADALFRRKPRRKGLPRSFTLPGGLSDVVRGLAATAGVTLQTGQEVATVERAGHGWRAVTAAGRVFEARYLSVALPPDRAAVVLADAVPELARLLAGIGMAEIESVGVAVPRTALQLAPLAGIIAPRDLFYAAVSRDYLEDPGYRGFTFHFRPGAAAPEQQLARIGAVLGVDPAVCTGLQRRHNRLPALRPGHAQRLEQLQARIPDQSLALVGNYFLGVSIEDCLSRCAAESARVFGA